MSRAATTLADPYTGAPRRDFLLGLSHGQLVRAQVPSWCSGHRWTLVAPNELARLASLQLVATRRLPRVQERRAPSERGLSPGAGTNAPEERRCRRWAPSASTSSRRRPE